MISCMIEVSAKGANYSAVGANTMPIRGRSAVYTVQCVEQTKCRAVQPQRGQWVVRVVRGAT